MSLAFRMLPVPRRIEIRETILALRDRGMSLAAISREVDVSVSTVRDLVDKRDGAYLAGPSRINRATDRITKEGLADLSVDAIHERTGIIRADIVEALHGIGKIDAGAILRDMAAKCREIMEFAMLLGASEKSMRQQCEKHGFHFTAQALIARKNEITPEEVARIRQLAEQRKTIREIREKVTNLSPHKVRTVVRSERSKGNITQDTGATKAARDKRTLQQIYTRKKKQESVKYRSTVAFMAGLPKQAPDPADYEGERRRMIEEYLKKGGKITKCPEAISLPTENVDPKAGEASVMAEYNAVCSISDARLRKSGLRGARSKQMQGRR